jgi:hypothetical protein
MEIWRNQDAKFPEERVVTLAVTPVPGFLITFPTGFLLCIPEESFMAAQPFLSGEVHS